MNQNSNMVAVMQAGMAVSKLRWQILRLYWKQNRQERIAALLTLGYLPAFVVADLVVTNFVMSPYEYWRSTTGFWVAFGAGAAWTLFDAARTLKRQYACAIAAALPKFSTTTNEGETP